MSRAHRITAAAALAAFGPGIAPLTARACPDCEASRAARAAVFGDGFWLQLLMLAPIPLLMLALCAFLYRIDKPAIALRIVAQPRAARHRGALIAAGAMLGIGLGGFVDGIVLHQLLQWHGLLSSRVEPIDLVTAKYNMLWDGIFHVLMWSATAAGIALLWHAAETKQLPHAGRALIGALALGWGAFNIVEGILNHHVYGLHHVHPGRDELAWDLGFLLVSGVMVLIGARLVTPPREAYGRDADVRAARDPATLQRIHERSLARHDLRGGP